MHVYGPGIRTTDARGGRHPSFGYGHIDIGVAHRSVVHFVDQRCGVPSARATRRIAIVDMIVSAQSACRTGFEAFMLFSSVICRSTDRGREPR